MTMPGDHYFQQPRSALADVAQVIADWVEERTS